MTAQPIARQKPLVVPGYCQEGCGMKLSVVNVDGICDECHDHPLDIVRPSKCARCRKVERQPGDCYCAECRNAIALANTRKRKIKYRRPLNLPCACCGKAPRHNGTSYCQRCGGEYQVERQQRRKAAPGQGVTA